jgi:hypothetical protein
MSPRISFLIRGLANGSPLGLLSIEGITQQYLWTQIVFCWVFDGIVIFWLYRGYVGMIALRRKVFNSVEYQGSLHSRTLLVIDVPKQGRSDEGLAQLALRFKPDDIHYAQAHIGRDVGELPELIEQHEKAVKRLEKYLAVYLKKPDKLPERRPACKPKGVTQKVDAIDYYTVRHIQILVNCRNAFNLWKAKLKRHDKPSHHAKQLSTASYPIPPSHKPIQ